MLTKLVFVVFSIPIPMSALCFRLVAFLAAFPLVFAVVFPITPISPTPSPSPWTKDLFGRARPAPSGCREFNAPDLWEFVASVHDNEGFVDWLQELVRLTALVTAEDPEKFTQSSGDTLDLLAAVLGELHLYCAVDKAEALAESGLGIAAVPKVDLKGITVSDVNALNATLFFDKVQGPLVPQQPEQPKEDNGMTIADLETPSSLEGPMEKVERPSPSVSQDIMDEVETPSSLQGNTDEAEEPLSLQSNTDDVEIETPSSFQNNFDEAETSSHEVETLSSDDDLTILQELIKKIIVEKGLSGSLRNVKVADLFNGLSEGQVTDLSSPSPDSESSTLSEIDLESSPDSYERTTPSTSTPSSRNVDIKTLSDLNICPSGSYCAFSGQMMVTGFRADSLEQWMGARHAIERKFISVLAQIFLDSKFGSLFDSIFVTSVSLMSDSTAMVEVELKLHPAEIEVNPSDLSSELSYALDELFYPYKVDHLETSFKLLCSNKYSHCSVSFPLTPELVETAEPKSSPIMFAIYMLILIFCVASFVWITIAVMGCFRTRSFKRRILNTSPLVLQELEAAYHSLNANHLYPTIHRKGTRSKSKSSIFDIEREKERMYQQSTLRSKAESTSSSSSSFEPSIELRCHSTLGGRKRVPGKVARRCQRQPRHTEEDFFLGRRSTLHRFSLRRTSLKQIASSFRLRKGSRRPNPSPAESDSRGVENLAYVVESSSPDPSPPSSQSSGSHGYATIGARTEPGHNVQTTVAIVETEIDL